MNILPSKSEIRKLFPDYVVSIEEREMNVAVGTLRLQKVSALIVTRIAHRTERYATARRYTNHPVEMDTLTDGLKVVKGAGYNAFCSNYGLAVISSSVTLGKF